jgi:hypothetical protein
MQTIAVLIGSACILSRNYDTLIPRLPAITDNTPFKSHSYAGAASFISL